MYCSRLNFSAAGCPFSEFLAAAPIPPRGIPTSQPIAGFYPRMAGSPPLLATETSARAQILGLQGSLVPHTSRNQVWPNFFLCRAPGIEPGPPAPELRI